MEYPGDYGLDEFLAGGGASSDMAVADFVIDRAFHGIVDLNLQGSTFGCSTLAVTSPEGNALFGRNFDWGNCAALIMQTRPKSGYTSISTVNMDFLSLGLNLPEESLVRLMSAAAPYAPMDGMNEKGLCVAVLMIEDSPAFEQAADKPDLTTTTAVRLLLDKAATVEEAVGLLAEYDLHASANMMVHFAISDATGRSVVVEYVNNEMNVTETPVVTNFYLTPGEKYGVGTAESQTRYAMLTNQRTKSNCILKTVGLTSAALRRIQLLQYGSAILSGMALGLAFTPAMSRVAAAAALITTGILVPADLPLLLCLGAYAITVLLLAGFITFQTAKIGHVTPMKAIRGETRGTSPDPKGLPAIRGTYLSLHLAVRQLLTGKKKYASVCIVALLLVFFASLIGRMDAWLGPAGKGMMDAFNPADHDLGVQTFGTLSEAEAEAVVLGFTEITDHYLLAMPSVSVNGVDVTANVISEPDRFHILAGRTCMADDEIVITETIAADRNAGIGDTLTIAGDSGSGDYVISGIYSCANDMGANVGMSREGYLKIGRDDPQIWCHHYFLADPTQKAAITETLENTYGGDIHIHENTWPGLLGIISAMGALVAFLYGMVAAFILIVTVMTGSKLLSSEQRDIGIYQAIGFSVGTLRRSFALRFGLTALLGAALGTAVAAVLTDPLVSSVMKLAGISNFASYPTVDSVLIPGLSVVLLFTVFAYLAAGKIRKTDLTVLITE